VSLADRIAAWPLAARRSLAIFMLAVLLTLAW
jgi:hypothetical protein